MIRRTHTIVTLLAAFALTGVASAQYQPHPADAQPAPTGGQPAMRLQSGSSDPSQQLKQFAQDPRTAPDKLFVFMEYCHNKFGEEISRQAIQKASNPQVKQVAQRFLEESQRAQQQLQSIAQQLNVQLPPELPEDQRQVIQILASLPAEQFEKHYMCGAEAHNAMAVIQYRHAAQLSENDQLKRYAQQQWAAASQRNDQIQQASAAVGLPGAGEAVPAAGRIQPRTSDNNADSQGTGTGGRGRPAP